MTVIAEDDLQIKLPAGAKARKFDDQNVHGLSHCMKAVDFIVDLDDRTFYIEFKDPQHPASQPKDREKFIRQFLSGQIDTDLKTKYRDSFLYECGSARASKPIYYLVLIGADVLSDADLLARTDSLKRQLPVYGPDGKQWKQNFIAGCAVMNLAAWNRFLPSFPASRLSA